ncbi:MAG: glycosyltransferase [Bacteroidota bacterium]
MKILFVLSGNKKNGSNLVENQAESLIKHDGSLLIDFYYVQGKGMVGYLKNIIPLRKKIKQFDPDLIHGHYSFCGFLSKLTLTSKPVITSLMGSDVQRKGFLFKLIIFFSNYWEAIIVKSQAINNNSYKCKTYVIPNGVSFSVFDQDGKAPARKELDLDPIKQYVLFLANPNRPEKNFSLAQNAFNNIKQEDMELLVIYDIPHCQTVHYLNAANVLVLSSHYEGSPNVVKEAMACNLPVVSTNVGDVEWLFAGTDGNYIAEGNVVDFSEKMLEALIFSKTREYTNGREKLEQIQLDSQSVAEKIVNVYKSILSK